MRLITIIACLSGCGEGPDPAPQKTTPKTGSDPEAQDTAEATDSGLVDTPPTNPALTGRLSSISTAHDETAVALVPIFFGEGPRIGTPVATSAPDESGEFRLSLPWSEPPLAHRYQVGEAQPLDVSGATYVTMAYSAAADASFESGSPIMGASLGHFLIWLDDTAPGQGWPAGWSVVDLGMEGTYGNGRCLGDTEVPLQWSTEDRLPVFQALTAAHVEVPLIGASASVALSIPARDATITHLVGLSYGYVFGTEPAAYLATDTPARDGFIELSLTQTVDTNALLNPTSQLPYALFVPLGYDDVDSSADWSTSDTLRGSTLCDTDDQRLMLRYTLPPTSWIGLKLMDCQQGRAGWSVVRRSTAGVWSERLDTASLEQIEMDPTRCSW